MKKPKKDPIFNLSERVAILETDMKWLKEKVEKIDSRVWYILVSVILGILITILTRLL
jgi:phosphopantetheine adenylyltransferase